MLRAKSPKFILLAIKVPFENSSNFFFFFLVILSFGVFNEIFPHKRVTASPQSSTAAQTEWSGPGIQYAGTDHA